MQSFKIIMTAIQPFATRYVFISLTESGMGGTKWTPFPALLLKSLFAAALYFETLSRRLAFLATLESSHFLPSLWKNNRDKIMPMCT